MQDPATPRARRAPGRTIAAGWVGAVLCLAVAACGAPAPEEPRGLVDVGDTGTAVTAVQYLLNDHGYQVDVTGEYDHNTSAAIIELQREHDLTPTGGVGPQTLTVLPVPVRPGDTGPAVKAAQTLLGEHGQDVSVEGVADQRTEKAVDRFRHRHDVPDEDGIGDATWAALLTDLDIDGEPVSAKEQFFEALAPYAKKAQRRHDVPAAVTIAQACQETGCGTSAPGNNYFGIKCHGVEDAEHPCESRETFEYEGGSRVDQAASFRSYGSMEESVEDYARFLSGNPRYAEAFRTRNPNDFARALEEAGYATDPQYAERLIALMEDNDLYRL